MTTENGLELVRYARRNIEVLRDRKEYLIDTIVERATEDRESPYQVAEVRAIEWALPILEAAWDVLARHRREVQHIEGRINDHDLLGKPFEWSDR